MTTPKVKTLPATADQATETPDQLRPLVVSSYPVFDNVILSAIVEAAPSPNSADNYVTKQLGWDNSVGRMVRDAVRLKERFPQSWEAAQARTSRPAAHLFQFASEATLDDQRFRYNEYDGSEKPHLFVQSAISMAGQVVPATSPLLLREWQFQPRGEVYTSFDGAGKGNFREGRWGLDDPYLFDPAYDARLKLTFNVDIHPQWQVIVPSPHPNQTTCWPSIYVMTWPVMITQAHEYPKFYKILCIEVRLPKDGAGTRFDCRDRAQIAWRMDINPGSDHYLSFPIGQLTLERLLAYSPSQRPVKLAVARKRYVLFGRGGARATNIHSQPSELAATEEEMGLHGGPGGDQCLEEACTDLLPTLAKMVRSTADLDLLDLLGERFIQLPPRDLMSWLK